MDNKHIYFSPLIESVLMDEELELLRKDFQYFSSLLNNFRSPTTPEEHRFLEVMCGNSSFETNHEMVWRKYSLLKEADSEIVNLERLKEDVCFLNQEVEKYLKNYEIAQHENKRLRRVIEELQQQQLLLKDRLDSLVNKESSMITLNVQEANLIVEKLINGGSDTTNVTRIIIEKIKKVHQPKALSSKGLHSSGVCKACGSNSPNLCRCSE